MPELAAVVKRLNGNSVGNSNATKAKIAVCRAPNPFVTKNITESESRRRSREPRVKWEEPETMVKLRYSKKTGRLGCGPTEGALGPWPTKERTSSAETAIRSIAKNDGRLESDLPTTEPPNIAKPKTSKSLKG